MNEHPTAKSASSGEYGGAGVKLLLVAVVLILLANAGYNFIPFAYKAESFRQDMQTAVVQAVAMPASYGKATEIAKRRILASAEENSIPADMVLEVKEQNKTVVARAHFVKKIPLLPFGIFNYDFVFDYTAAPSGFLTK